MSRSRTIRFSILAAAVLAACTAAPRAAKEPTPMSDTSLEIAGDIPRRLAKLPATTLDGDRAGLPPSEQRALAELVTASRHIDAIFYRQQWAANPALYARLAAAARNGVPRAAEALAFFQMNKGPWDQLEEGAPFVGKERRPKGAGFYPEDLEREDLERWMKDHPEQKDALQSTVTVVERDTAGNLIAVPYSQAYREHLVPAAEALRRAAAATANPSLRTYLEKVAAAFASNDYFDSDMAWMDLDSDIEVVIGPYETYGDELMSYKAAFESFVTVRDRVESEKLSIYEKHLPEMERRLPIPDEHKNPNRGASSPIRVVNEVFTSGDARTAVQTSAFNLPNDERVREAKGSKKVMLKNVMEAKFRLVGKPIADRVLVPAERGAVSFDAFFNHVLFHELSHGLGPGLVAGPDGNRVDVRLLLKTSYSAIEECKADVVGILNVLYAFDEKLLTGFGEHELFVTDAALLYRSMRFGLNEAHGRGAAVQWSWYRERGAIVAVDGGGYRVDDAKFREATRALAHELLMIQATGDEPRARKLLEDYGKATPEIERLVASLTDIPVDIRPVFPAAGE